MTDKWVALISRPVKGENRRLKISETGTGYRPRKTEIKIRTSGDPKMRE
jgi:hypothetical protein